MFTRILSILAGAVLMVSCTPVSEPVKPTPTHNVTILSDNAVLVYKTCSKAVVSIWGLHYGEYEFFGTGFVIKAPGLTGDVVVTAAHVVDMDTVYQIRDKEGKIFKNLKIWSAATNDVAFIVPDGEAWSFENKLELADKNPEIGTTTYIIGHPAVTYKDVYWYVMSEGIVKNYIAFPGVSTGVEDWTGDTMMVSNDIHPGNSGSTVLNERGEVVGIAVSGYTGVEHVNFAVPIEILKEEIAKYLLSLQVK